MNKQKGFAIVFFASLIVACVQFNVLAQTATMESRDTALANVNSAGSSVRWDMRTSSSDVTLTVVAPDGRVFSKDFTGGASPQFSLSSVQGERLPDGQYTYELRLTPAAAIAHKDALANGRGKQDVPESVRAAEKSAPAQNLVESGSFLVINGAVIVAGGSEDGSRRSSKVIERQKLPGDSTGKSSGLQLHHPARVFMPDDVIPDDLIVQGSICSGVDCINNENFGFDTIRLKENNTRIQFDDTSTSAGFPTNNWQIRANSSASGGANFLAFLDQGATGNSETGTIVFEVDAGAPANALKVASNGKVGLRTATPVLDLHIATSDTPAQRLEQTNAGGFTAQTWDIAGNEASFFIRDVTAGSRLPFRIRPGAPSSSIDISASGNVGIGTASPELRLDAKVANTATDFTNTFTYAGSFGNFSGKRVVVGYDETVQDVGLVQSVQTGVGFKNLAINPNGGNVGIGTIAPTALLSVNGTANKPGGGSWDVFSDERLKNIKGNFNSGLQALMRLQPIRYQYKQDNALGLKPETENIGFGAQSLQKVIPEAVTRNSNGYLMVNNDPILWTMLNAIKEQQKEIAELKGQVRKLRAASRRRR
jgi:Chaperone of endosialidase